MSENVFISEDLESLLPEGFREQLKQEEPTDFAPGQVQSASIYSDLGTDKFSVEFVTDHESARKVFLTSLHKTIQLPSYFGQSLLKVESIEIKGPGPTLTIGGIVTYR